MGYFGDLWKRIGETAKGGEATVEPTLNLDSIAAIGPLEQALDKPTGDLFEQYDAISPELKAIVGRIQAATIAATIAYDAPKKGMLSKNPKDKLEKAGLIKDSFKGDSKEFNAKVLFDLSDDAGSFPTLEEKATAIADALEAKVKKAGVTDEQLQQGNTINASREGVNQDPKAHTAVPVTPIYNAISPDLAAAGRAVTAIHIAIRSGAGRQQAGQPDINLANKAQKTNFHGKIFPNDPSHIRRMLKSGARLNAFERDEDGATPPILEDVINIQDGLATGLSALKTVSAKLGKKADLSKLVDDVEKYRNATKGWKPAVIKAPEADTEENEVAGFQLGPEEDEAPEIDAVQDPLAASAADVTTLQGLRQSQEDEAVDAAVEAAVQKARAEFNGTEGAQNVNNDLANTIARNQFLATLIKGIGENNISPNLNVLMNDGSSEWLADNLKIVSAKENESVLSDKSGGHQFKVTPISIEHIDTDDVLSAEEALQYAKIASLNLKMVKRGLTITGSSEEKAMLKLAIDEVNKDLKHPIKVLNEDDIEVTPTAQARMDAQLDERRNEEGKISYADMPRPLNDNTVSATEPNKAKIPEMLRRAHG